MQQTCHVPIPLDIVLLTEEVFNMLGHNFQKCFRSVYDADKCLLSQHSHLAVKLEIGPFSCVTRILKISLDDLANKQQ